MCSAVYNLQQDPEERTPAEPPLTAHQTGVSSCTVDGIAFFYCSRCFFPITVILYPAAAGVVPVLLLNYSITFLTIHVTKTHTAGEMPVQILQFRRQVRTPPSRLHLLKLPAQQIIQQMVRKVG